LKIIAALAVFCVLIITHELGHFVVAKMSGIYVYSFNLGMGPKLFSFTKGETEYTIRLLPLGGSVMMMGEDDDTCDDDPRSFNRQAVWKRICTIAAGPLMNFVTAIVLFIIVFMMLGTASDANIIGGVIEGSAAEAAGLQAGDQILYIGDYLIEKWNDISPAIAAAGAGNPLDIVFLRDGVQQQLTLQPYFDEASGNWMIGIQSSVARQSLSTAIKLGFMQTYLFTKEIIVTLGAMILGKTAVELSGPVGIVTVIGEASTYGLMNVLLLTAYLSVNLGLLNLLPIPALDGSRIVFLAIEGLRGKPFDREKEGMVHAIGLLLLLGLMVLVTYQDIARLIN
ncbi:MAG: RIP metalloprotease RseP, partial [Firmicutes bacterium]|nr:RIP metalloprotease RseP [Bacillota bacterium]